MNPDNAESKRQPASLLVFFFLFIPFFQQTAPVSAQGAGPDSVSATGNYTVTLLTDGSLWAWGQNDTGQLGDGTNIGRSLPVQVGKEKNWKMVSAGWDHVLALKVDGSLWAWGDNKFSQLGDGSTQNRSLPVQIGEGRDWVVIEAAEDFSLAIRSDDTLWAWGKNDHGQLGIGEKDKISVSVPTQVGLKKEWKSISAFFKSILAIRKDGSLWGWGDNHYYQLGRESTADVFAPVEVGQGDGWIQISAGDSHSLAIRSDGTLWGAGRNNVGQLADGTSGEKNFRKTFSQIGSETDWVHISAGGFHSLALKRGGSLWGWGFNREGQLSSVAFMEPVTTPVRISGPSIWKSVEAGNDHSIGIRSDGILFGWGWNLHGQVGIGKNRSGAGQFITSPTEIIINRQEN